MSLYDRETFIHDTKKMRGAMQDLPTDPKQAAKDVVGKAREQYSEDTFKEFRYRTMKEFEGNEKEA